MVKIESIVKLNTKNHFEKPQKVSVQDNLDYNVVSCPATAKCTAKNLQAYYCIQPSFGHLNSHHIRNCGAYVDKSKKVFFSLFSDAEKVFLVLKRAVSGEEVHYPMEIDDRNIFRLELQPNQAEDGDKYAFKLVRNGKNMLLPDPMAHRKTDFLSPFSEIYDHHKFDEWTDQNWCSGQNFARISRLENSGLTSIKQARIYEMNIPTFSKEGTFDGAIEEMKKLIERGHFKQDGTGTYNAIEITPIGLTYAPSWGYDEVFKGAPMETYGGPDAVKRFVNFLHKNGINVGIHGVPNHWGPDGNPFKLLGPYFNPKELPKGTGFGPRPNFENDPRNNTQIRDIINEVCFTRWLREYHFDYVRLDFTQQMDSNSSLRYGIEEANHHHPHSLFILEDERTDMTKVLCSPIPPQATDEAHVRSIAKYQTNENPLTEIGANARWGYEFHHAMVALLKGEISVEQFYKIFTAAIARGDVLYGVRQSHDEAGNMDGIKAVVDLTSHKLGMFRQRVNGNSNEEKGQRAAQATQAILSKWTSGEYNPEIAKKISAEYHVKNMPSNEEIAKALDSSIAKNKVSESIVKTTPNNPEMRFQGSLADVTPFRFFRTLSNNAIGDYEMLRAQKGYLAGVDALNESKMGSIPYTKEYQKVIHDVDQYEIDLNDIVQSSDALKTGKIVSPPPNPKDTSKVLSLHIKKDESEVFSVSNFSDFSYNGNYEINFPRGQWQPAICSEDTKYAGSGNNIQRNDVVSNGVNKSTISIPANSFTLFKKIS